MRIWALLQRAGQKKLSGAVKLRITEDSMVAYAPPKNSRFAFSRVKVLKRRSPIRAAETPGHLPYTECSRNAFHTQTFRPRGSSFTGLPTVRVVSRVNIAN